MGILRTIILFISSFFLAVLPAPKYTEGILGQPRSFLPSLATTQGDKTVSRLIFRGLFKYDIYGTLTPDLAESWNISEDGLIYTIKLKANQKWSDGSRITSDDLIYTAFKFSDLSQVSTDKVDDLTVRYTLPNKFSPFLSLLTVGIMPAGAEEKYNELKPVSSGPFRVLRIEKNGPIITQVTLYDTMDNSKIKKLVFKYYPNEDEIETGAKLGEIDAFLANPETKFNLENFEEYKFPLQSVYYALFFNLSNEKFKDELFRQKLEKVIPVETFIADIGIPVQGAISRSIFTDSKLKFNKFDSTFTGNLSRQKITITIPDSETHKQIAKRVKDAWEAALNLEVIIKEVQTKEIEQKIIKTKDYEVLLYGQEVGRDPDRYVNWHSTQVDYPGLNISGFSHVRADRALEEGRNETDSEQRILHYNEFQKVVYEQVPAVFLYHPYEKYYINKYLKGFGEKYTFTDTDRFLDFNNWEWIKTN